MKNTETTFIAVGLSTQVLDLADGRLSGTVIQRVAIGQTIPRSNETAEKNSVIIKLPSVSDDPPVGARDWVEKHLQHLKACDARMVVEFQTFLEPEIGSRILTVPNALAKLCGDAGLDIANQSFRIP